MTSCRHEAVRELLPGAALDALSRDERGLVTAQLLRCERCASELDYLRITVAELAHLASGTRPDELRLRRTRVRLLARAAADRRSSGRRPASAVALPGRAASRTAWLQDGGWLTAATLAGLLLTHHTFHQPLDYGWVAASALGAVVVGMLFYLRGLRRRMRALEARVTRPDQPHPPSA